MAIRFSKLVLLSTVAIPMGPLLAQPDYSFRPMGGEEPPTSQQVSPGWRTGAIPKSPPAAPAVPATTAQGAYSFAPQEQRATGGKSNQPAGRGDFAHFRYKPEDSEPASEPPPPLPPPIDPASDPAMVGYGAIQQAPGQVPSTQQQPGQAGVSPFPPLPPPPFSPPERLARPERPQPPQPPKPLRLEGRYIDGVKRHQQHAYPFRPFDEEKKPERASRQEPPVARAPASTAYARQSYGQQPYAGGYQYPPPPPPAYAYPPAPYDYGYNSGRSSNNFPFPFGGNGFPFSFR